MKEIIHHQTLLDKNLRVCKSPIKLFQNAIRTQVNGEIHFTQTLIQDKVTQIKPESF